MFELENKTCYIVPNSLKMRILLNMTKQGKILDVKVYTLNEILDKIEIKYDCKAIHYLMNKYNFNYENTKMYLDNLKYINNINYNVEKLDFLSKLKQELIEKKLIEEDINIQNLKQYKMKIYGYEYIDNYYINLLNKYFNVEKINMNINPNKINIHKFQNQEDEITFIFDKINKYLIEGIDINKIKIVNYSSSYEMLIKRMSKFYNIPVFINEASSLYSIDSVKIFYTKLEQIKDKTEAYQYLKEICNDENIINQVLNILNNYYFIDNLDDKALEAIKYELKNTKVKTNIFKNCIEVKNLFDTEEDDYVFLINFNEGEIPKNYKDIDFINDNIKSILGIDATYLKNKKLAQKTVDKINSIKNIIITYKEKDYFSSYLVSPLIYKLDCQVFDDYKYDYNNSKANNKMVLAKKLDKLIKYGIKDDILNILYSNYKDINYRTYDNKFKELDKNKLCNYLNNKLTLSYSSIEIYNECAFKYYINNILKINDSKESFKAKIGTLFHNILSKIYEENYDYKKDYENSIKEFSTNKEKFLAHNLSDELVYIVNTINEQEKYIELKDIRTELKIKINFKDKIDVNFVGIIDKLKFKKIDNNYLAAVIDYKTGSPDTSLKNINYGLNMQLPIYFYLLKRMDKDKKVIPIGMYYQKILSNKLNNPKDYEKERKEFFKLEGYSNSDEEILKYFDKCYKDSNLIKSMKQSQNGFYAYSKVISTEEFEQIDTIVDYKIKEVINKICNADFSINPKRIDKKNISCEYCTYKDICFRQEKDIIDIKQTSLKEVLGGDLNE